MRLLIIASDSSGAVTLASPRVFADAAEATRELARLFAEGAAGTSASFYTIDMDTAVPVIILQQPVVAPPLMQARPSPEEPVDPLAALPLDEHVEQVAEEPAFEPVVQPADQPVGAAVDEPVDTAVDAPVEIPVEQPAGAAAEVPAEEPCAVLDDAAAEQPADDFVAVPVEALDTMAADGDQVQPEAETAPAAGAQWPWDLPVIPEEGTADAPAGETLAGADVPAGDIAAEPEEASDEAPVVDLDAVRAERSADEGQPVADEPPAFEAASFNLPSQGKPDLSFLAEALAMADAPADPAPVADPHDPPVQPDLQVVAEPQSVLEAGNAEVGVAGPETVYEPGALNMNEYTCSDCVYVNTCPNRDQKKPAECGSFQWKA